MSFGTVNGFWMLSVAQGTLTKGKSVNLLPYAISAIIVPKALCNSCTPYLPLALLQLTVVKLVRQHWCYTAVKMVCCRLLMGAKWHRILPMPHLNSLMAWGMTCQLITFLLLSKDLSVTFSRLNIATRHPVVTSELYVKCHHTAFLLCSLLVS